LDAAEPPAVFCAPEKSTLMPEIKVEITRMAMVRDLYRVFIILDPLNGGKQRLYVKRDSINENNFNRLIRGKRINGKSMESKN
jgi:hypothetical protein